MCQSPPAEALPFSAVARRGGTRAGLRDSAGWTPKTQAGILERVFSSDALPIRDGVAVGAVDCNEEEAMGWFDDSLKNAVPGGNLATPIAVAAGALILGKLFGGGSSPAPSPAAPPSVPTNVPNSSVIGGLSDLIGRLTAGGAAPQVNSWVGPGENQPIQPGQLGGALGQQTLNELSQRTGMSQQELLNQLALVLPQLINSLTPRGRVPTAAELDQQ
jgi:uncharacterized protein YidB (DUF937 family)